MHEDIAQTIAKLRRSSTASISTMLFKRGLRNVAMRGLRCVSGAAGTMAGEAFTVRSIPSREDLDTVEILRSSEHPQRKAFDSCPPGRVLVADSRGETYAAFGGGILIARLAARGAAGMVSDGSVRDLAEVSGFGFPVFCAGAAPPLSLARHHAVDVDVPIGCGGVAVFPGDIVVGDADGVVVVPRHLAADIADDAVEQDRYDRFALEEIQSGRSLLGTYPATDESRARYAQWLKKQMD